RSTSSTTRSLPLASRTSSPSTRARRTASSTDATRSTARPAPTPGNASSPSSVPTRPEGLWWRAEVRRRPSLPGLRLGGSLGTVGRAEDGGDVRRLHDRAVAVEEAGGEAVGVELVARRHGRPALLHGVRAARRKLAAVR